MASSLKTMNQVRKPVKKTAPVAAAAGAENESPVVEKAVNKILKPEAKKKTKVNNAVTPEDAIMQSEAVTPDLEKAVVPKKKEAKKSNPRAKKTSKKKK